MVDLGRTLVIGDGGWGQALAMALHRAGRSVTVWGFDGAYTREVAESRENRLFLPGVRIPKEILWTGDIGLALANVKECFSVVPTQFLRATLDRFEGKLSGLPVISASKGLELETLETPTQILMQSGVAEKSVAVLSGPSHAEEVCRGLATTVVVASDVIKLAECVRDLIKSETFRVYTSSDLIGVEMGGALKNIIAVAAGIVDAMGLGDNAKAALVSRGLIEMARFGEYRGARRETFFGLSGAGDLMVTCYSQHSRNRSLGERIGSGESLDGILKTLDKVAEGVWTCRAVYECANREGIEMPITAALYEILFEQANPHESLQGLMKRPSGLEIERYV